MHGSHTLFCYIFMQSMYVRGRVKRNKSARKDFVKRSLSMSSFSEVLLLLFHLGNSGLFLVRVSNNVPTRNV